MGEKGERRRGTNRQWLTKGHSHSIRREVPRGPNSRPHLPDSHHCICDTPCPHSLQSSSRCKATPILPASPDSENPGMAPGPGAFRSSLSSILTRSYFSLVGWVTLKLPVPRPTRVPPTSYFSPQKPSPYSRRDIFALE